MFETVIAIGLGAGMALLLARSAIFVFWPDSAAARACSFGPGFLDFTSGAPGDSGDCGGGGDQGHSAASDAAA